MLGLADTHGAPLFFGGRCSPDAKSRSCFAATADQAQAHCFQLEQQCTFLIRVCDCRGFWLSNNTCSCARQP